MKRYIITIAGNVQRVGFRNYSSKEAKRLGLAGKAVYIDQDIMIEVEGLNDSLTQFIQWCHKGPEGCKIDGFDIKELPILGYASFEAVPGLIWCKKGSNYRESTLTM